MWDPFRDMDRLLNRLQSATGSGFFATTARGSWAPAIDIIENPDSYKILADVPGMSREDISVDIEGNRLCIGGNRKSLLKEEEQHLAVMSERGSGRFERCVQLPSRPKEDSVKARLRDSVLIVEVNKSKTQEDRAKNSVTIN
ncbi:heat shock protein 20 [Trypanosoma grayi]|uniref:heat shock protein 20 n=1 Tax=Trypanosoma grayi TaxID=71804 RepID=UPI0004F4034B|nr:heat shock protein 20 [Trypanosoma grayi]KEG10408.1 heat shock protein 20 [Trypanosoma grayi]